MLPYDVCAYNGDDEGRQNSDYVQDAPVVKVPSRIDRVPRRCADDNPARHEIERVNHL